MRTRSAWKHSFLSLAIVAGIAACSGGGGSDSVGSDSGSNQTTQRDVNATLSNATIVYSKSPRIGEELSLSVSEHSETGQSYTWSVVSEPLGAGLVLTPMPAAKGVTMTPVIAGKYQIQVASDTESAIFGFTIKANFPFAQNKVSLYEGSFADATYVGRVSNQVWLYSQTLNQDRLEQLAAQYPAFQVIGFDPVSGLLLQFDDTNLNSLTALGDLRLASGVNSVVNRVVTGERFIEQSDLTPDDGSSFSDGGDNWHLERIGAEQAWDITTGKTNMVTGISEPTPRFFKDHEELSGRFSFTMAAEDGDGSHPSSVAGAIGANTDNGKGMSGINWVGSLGTADSGEDGLTMLTDLRVMRVINSSWSLVNAPDEGTDMADQSVASAREERAFEGTRAYRKLMQKSNDHLFVNSAGNGVKGSDGTAIDGRYHSPALHYNEIGVFRPLGNVLFVAAMEDDGKLRESSNYGESVEIAAPSGYKSIEGEDGYRTFRGTSSAAPVVTGVASLIYSLSANFSPATVKRILLSSATEFVTERHTESSDDGATEPLPNPIPIVNAAAALQMAKDLAAGLEAEITQRIDNPFRNISTVEVLSATGEWETTAFPYRLNSIQGLATGPEARLTLDDPTVPLTLNSFEVKFLNRELGTTSTGEFEQALENPNIVLNLYNKGNYLPVSNARITIEPVNVSDARFDSAAEAAGADGQTRVYLMSGEYRVIVKAAGYKVFRSLINIVNEGQRIFVNLPLTPTSDPSASIGTNLNSCLIGRWSLDMAHYQQQLDLADSGFQVSGSGIAKLTAEGDGIFDVRLKYKGSNGIGDEQSFISTIDLTSRDKFRWRTRDSNFLVDSLGTTSKVITVVTIDGVTIPDASGEVPDGVSRPVDLSASFVCDENTWSLEPFNEDATAVRFQRL